MKRLLIDAKENCHGEISMRMNHPADSGDFVFESLVLAIEQFSKSCGVPPQEIIKDMEKLCRS